MWRPVSAGNVLYPVLAVMAGISIWVSVARGWKPNRAITNAALLLLLVAALGAAVASIEGGTDGLNQQMIQWFGSIVIWFAFANAFTVKFARRALLVITVMTAAVAGVIVLYVASNQGLLPAVIPQSVVQGQGAGYADTDQGSAIRWLGLSTLTAATPLMLSAAIVGKDAILPSRKLTAVVGLVALAATVVAGRRAILVVAVVSPLIALVMRRWLTRTERRKVRIHPAWVYGAPFLVLAAFAAWGTSPAVRARQALSDTMATYFGAGSGSGTVKTIDDVVRVEESRNLLDAWSQSPVFGKGLGATIEGYSRSDLRPWTFELQYHVLLFNTGLVGVVLCLVALFIAGRELKRVAVACPHLVPSLTATSVAAVSLLAANASNPYLQAVGHGWGIALAAGIVTAAARVAEAKSPAPAPSEARPLAGVK